MEQLRFSILFRVDRPEKVTPITVNPVYRSKTFDRNVNVRGEFVVTSVLRAVVPVFYRSNVSDAYLNKIVLSEADDSYKRFVKEKSLDELVFRDPTARTNGIRMKRMRIRDGSATIKFVDTNDGSIYLAREEDCVDFWDSVLNGKYYVAHTIDRVIRKGSILAMELHNGNAPRYDGDATSPTDEDLCKVCYANRKGYATLPCGHFAYCRACVEIVEKGGKGCAVCKQIVVTYCRIVNC